MGPENSLSHRKAVLPVDLLGNLHTAVQLEHRVTSTSRANHVVSQSDVVSSVKVQGCLDVLCVDQPLVCVAPRNHRHVWIVLHDKTGQGLRQPAAGTAWQSGCSNKPNLLVDAVEEAPDGPLAHPVLRGCVV